MSRGVCLLALLYAQWACSAPAPTPKPAPTPSTRPAGERPGPIAAYRRQVLARQGLAMLDELGHRAVKTWKRETWDSNGSLLAQRFTRSLPGWYPSRPCCSFSGRRCPPVEKIPSVWDDLSVAALKRPRHFQLRYFSSGVGEKSSFVADARGDVGCDGQLVWFRIRGHVTKRSGKHHVQLSPPEVVRGEDPREAPMATVKVLGQVLRGDEPLLHGQALKDLGKHPAGSVRSMGRALLEQKEERLRRAALTLLWPEGGRLGRRTCWRWPR